MTPLTSGYVMEKYYIARTAGLIGGKPFWKKGLFPQTPFPKTSVSFWQGAAIFIKFSI